MLVHRVFVAVFAIVLSGSVGYSHAGSGSFEAPEVIEFGASVSEMESALAALCDSQATRIIDPPMLPDTEIAQQQIDCSGFAFLGAPREAEFVFRDDSLEMVWILTSADEDADILEFMKSTLGEPSHSSDAVVAFTGSRTALRREPPEVLFYSESLAPTYEQFFSANSGE